jgi:hypothetical protein
MFRHGICWIFTAAEGSSSPRSDTEAHVDVGRATELLLDQSISASLRQQLDRSKANEALSFLFSLSGGVI